MKNKFARVIDNFYSSFANLKKAINIRLSKNIRLQLMGIFVICVIASIIIGVTTSYILQIKDQSLRIANIINTREINNLSIKVAGQIEKSRLSSKDAQKITQILEASKADKYFKSMICNLEGNVLYRSSNVKETKVNLPVIIKNYISIIRKGLLPIENVKTEYNFFSFYPVKFSDVQAYIIILPNAAEKLQYRDIAADTKFITMIVVITSFVILFFLLTNKKMKYIKFVSMGLLEISKGNLDYRIKRQGDDELALLADNINYMAGKLKQQYENERRAERIKNELITNVSHDLRTPLTSIKGYLELIKRKEYKQEQQLEQYVDIVYNKTEKLEVLVNDLFEYTKLINNTVPVIKEEIVLNELLEQLIEEFVPVCEENRVTMTKDFMKEKLTVNLDPNKTVRVFENLLVNAIRYSLKPSDIKIALTKEEDYLVVSIKNSCNPLSKNDLEKIFERFYRVEKSRSSDTGGSGLGLAIAKSMVEIQGGTIDVESIENTISFIVKFKL